MFRLRRYVSELAARQAADHLKYSGIPAVVHGGTLANTLGIGASPFLASGYDVFIPDKRLAERAGGLLAAFEAPADADPTGVADAWASSIEPDLSCLDPSRFAIDCSACRASLPLDASLQRCPSCGVAVDTVARVVELHGPEALEDAYPEHDTGPPAEAVRFEDIPLSCAHCGYNLAGLRVSGRCPDCGTLFDKREMLRNMR